MTTLFLFVGYAIAVPLLQYYGFYKQHFGNEGYFTFSLPVTTHQHVLSSAVCVLIWNLFMYVTVILAGVLLILPSALKHGSGFFGTVSTIYTDGQLIFAIIF